MVASMKGAPRVAVAKLNIPEMNETGIDWIYHAPNAPRTGKGSRYRQEKHAFSPAEMLKRSPFAKLRSPVFRRSPTGRRRSRKSSSADADAVSGPVPPLDDLPTSGAFSSVFAAAANGGAPDSGRRGSLLPPKTPAPPPSARNVDPLSANNDVNPSSAKTPAPAPRKQRRARLSVEGGGFFGGGRASMAPACFPQTPAPPPPPGEKGLKTWLEEAGLDKVYGLLDCLLFWRDGSLSSVDKLRDADNYEILEAIAPIKLKGIKMRKFIASLDTLRGEAAAFVPERPAMEWRDGMMERALNVSPRRTQHLYSMHTHTHTHTHTHRHRHRHRHRHTPS